MRLDARTATAADFDAAAQRHANNFWGWFVTTGAVWYFFHWWSLIPAALTIWSAISSIGATTMAQKLRNGTYRFPNPNNGAPDGDAKNYKQSNP